MAINSKDIEALWKRYSDEGVKKGISVVQFFESNGVPYHTFEKWYKRSSLRKESSIVLWADYRMAQFRFQILRCHKPLNPKGVMRFTYLMLISV